VIPVDKVRKIPGVLPIWRSLHGFLISPDILQIRCTGLWLFVNSRDQGVASFLIDEGVYEKLETKLFEDSVKPGMVVIDVGSNVGYYALIAAKLLDGTGHVYAFEPDPKNYDLLTRNILENKYTNVFAVNKAVADKASIMKLFLGSRNFAGNSLSQANITSGSSVVEVDAISLDQFVNETGLASVDLLKIDVEGAEGLVCGGARRLLASGNTRIFMEFWPEGLRKLGTDALDLAHHLMSYGYSISVIDEIGKRLQKLKDESDILRIIERCNVADTEQDSRVNLLLEKKTDT